MMLKPRVPKIRGRAVKTVACVAEVLGFDSSSGQMFFSQRWSGKKLRICRFINVYCCGSQIEINLTLVVRPELIITTHWN